MRTLRKGGRLLSKESSADQDKKKSMNTMSIIFPSGHGVYIVSKARQSIRVTLERLRSARYQ
jgi:hypothetical protein